MARVRVLKLIRFHRIYARKRQDMRTCMEMIGSSKNCGGSGEVSCKSIEHEYRPRITKRMTSRMNHICNSKELSIDLLHTSTPVFGV